MKGWLGDLGCALRTLRRRPASSAVALAALALGLAANTMVMSVVSAVVVAPLPYPESDRLVVLWQRAPISGYEELPLSIPDYLDLRRLRTVFDALAGFEHTDVTWTGGERPRELHAVAATPDLFPALRAEAALGRTLRPGDAEPGSDPVVVVSHGFWQREMGGDEAAIGRRLVLNERPHTVVGILARELRFPFPMTWQGRTWQAPPTDVFVSLTLDATADRGEHRLMSLARLAPGVSIEEAGRRLGAAMSKLAAEHPDVHPPGLDARVVAAKAQSSEAVRPALYLLLGSVVLLLLVGCANVANLLLTRATERAKEISVRSAFGASRWRLVRLLLSESLVLALGGTVAGTFLAAWGIQALSRLQIEEMPRLADARLDTLAVGWGVALTVATTIVFGLLPAFYGVRPDLVRALKASAPGLTIGPARGRLLQGVVVFELALCAALLVAAGWMMRGWQALSSLDPGFDLAGVTAVELPLNAEPYADDARCRYTVREVLASVLDLPGVEAAGVGSYVPLSGQENAAFIVVEGQVPRTPAEVPFATLRQVTPGFLEALGVRRLEGRALRDSDHAAAPRVVLVNRILAQRLWPGVDPMGRRLKLAEAEAPWWTVVGVVADVRDRRPDRGAEPTIFFPLDQNVVRRLTLVVRSSEELARDAPVIEQAVWSVDPGLPVRLRDLRDVVRDVLGRFELNAYLLGGFALAALALAAIGVYGVLSFVVEQRRHEMAIRLALGARREQLAALVFRQGAALAAAGMALGLVLAVALARMLRSVVYALAPLDAMVVAGVPAVLFAIVALCALHPARRASRVDAVGPLRAE